MWTLTWHLRSRHEASYKWNTGGEMLKGNELIKLKGGSTFNLYLRQQLTCSAVLCQFTVPTSSISISVANRWRCTEFCSGFMLLVEVLHVLSWSATVGPEWTDRWRFTGTSCLKAQGVKGHGNRFWTYLLGRWDGGRDRPLTLRLLQPVPPSQFLPLGLHLIPELRVRLKHNTHAFTQRVFQQPNVGLSLTVTLCDWLFVCLWNASWES